MKKDIFQKIKNSNLKISVIGLGQVGLPTAAAFLSANYRVYGIDIDEKKIQAIYSGNIPINDTQVRDVLINAIDGEKLELTTDFSKGLVKADVIILSVPTPISSDKSPDLSAIRKACEEMGANLSREQLVIVESTLPPNTAKEKILPILESKSGLKCGSDFWFAYCPERIAPGESMREYLENDRVIGGYDDTSSKIAVKLYETVIDGNILPTDILSAELSKLFENTYRDVNIALANEFALLCEKIGADIQEVIELTNTHPRVNILAPGCGVGGPCLPKDPYFLLSGTDFDSKIIMNSRKINDKMPIHVVNKLCKALKEKDISIENSRIAILGTAYKGGIDDSRNSPAGKIIEKLLSMGAKVSAYDPYSDEDFGAEMKKDIKSLKNLDAMVIATDHEEFKKIDFSSLKNKFRVEKPIIFDTRRIIDPERILKLKFRYWGIGYNNK